MSETKRCQRCGENSGHDAIGDARCALRIAYRDDLRSVAADLDQPVAPAFVDDLLWHIKTVYDDGMLAHRAALRVLELGWRPVVGCDRKAW